MICSLGQHWRQPGLCGHHWRGEQREPIWYILVFHIIIFIISNSSAKSSDNNMLLSDIKVKAALWKRFLCGLCFHSPPKNTSCTMAHSPRRPARRTWSGSCLKTQWPSQKPRSGHLRLFSARVQHIIWLNKVRRVLKIRLVRSLGSLLQPMALLCLCVWDREKESARERERNPSPKNGAWWIHPWQPL